MYTAHKTTCKERLIKQLADELAGGVNFLAEPLLLNTHSPHADHSVYKHNNDGSDNYYLMIHRNRVNWLRFREVQSVLSLFQLRIRKLEVLN